MPVTEEVTGIEGITTVDVDLATGRVDVTTDRPVTRDQVREAVEEAGYALA
jgi:copper chaperone CopZ